MRISRISFANSFSACHEGVFMEASSSAPHYFLKTRNLSPESEFNVRTHASHPECMGFVPNFTRFSKHWGRSSPWTPKGCSAPPLGRKLNLKTKTEILYLSSNFLQHPTPSPTQTYVYLLFLWIWQRIYLLFRGGVDREWSSDIKMCLSVTHFILYNTLKDHSYTLLQIVYYHYLKYQNIFYWCVRDRDRDIEI